jgi:NAD(P)-dependent dehydrogenase (short-subunit alcohol dehydrogenase family)
LWRKTAGDRHAGSMSRLAQKVIVVIGGTGGIGLSAARAFASEGARLIVVGRDRERVTAAGQELGEAVRGMVGDAAESGTADRAVALAVEVFGRLDGLYHVAGGSGRRMGDGPLHAASDEGWRETLRINLDSVFYSNRAAVNRFLEQGGSGTVLNLGSVLGSSPSPRYFATCAYAAAKAAIEGMTRTSAACYADRDIRFNVLAPALVATPMSGRAQEDAAIMSFIRGKQPLDGGRIGRPEDLDAAAVFFMSDESRFTTGQTLHVDGGWGVTEGQQPS